MICARRFARLGAPGAPCLLVLLSNWLVDFRVGPMSPKLNRSVHETLKPPSVSDFDYFEAVSRLGLRGSNLPRLQNWRFQYQSGFCLAFQKNFPTPQTSHTF